MAILRANELERRDSSLVRLEKARGDTEEYRNELERILEDLRATSPIMSLPPVETVEDLEMETIDAPLAVLGRGLLPASGLCFIHAASGIGKTLFALQLCAAISLGEPFFNWPTFPRRILYLQGELSRVWWQVRSRSLRAFMGRPLPDLLFAHESFPLMTFKGQTRATMAYSVLGFRKLRAMVEKHKADMVVIDPLSSYYELEENSTDQNREFQKRLLEFRRDTLTTVVLVHHDRKPQAFERSAMRGSSVLRDYADLSISIRKKPKSGPGVLTVSFDKTRHCAPPDDFYVLQTLQSFFIIHTPPRRKGKDVHEGTEKDVVEPEQYPLEEVEGGEPGEE